jgi:hypothetical protein
MQRSHRRDDTVIDRLAHAEAEIERLAAAVGVLLRVAASATIRQAAIDAGHLLTLKQCAHDAGVAESTIRFWIGKGLPFETIGVKRYVSKDALREFMARRK